MLFIKTVNLTFTNPLVPNNLFLLTPMIGVHKFSLKNIFSSLLSLSTFCIVTWQSKASDITNFEIYSTLTTDTIKPLKRAGTKDSIFSPTSLQSTIPLSSIQDTIPLKKDSVLRDTIIPLTDTFSLKISKDTLDGPVEYEAEDSAVILVIDKKMILYGKTRTTYQDINLTAPKVEFDQQTNIVTAVSEKDSTGYDITRARFEQQENRFESDTIQFNFKSQKGFTKNTFTQQDEIFVQGEVIKKVNSNTIFIKEGRFTTCNLDEPHFDFRSKRMKVINSKVAVTGYVQLAFEDVPIPKPIGLPFGIFPLTRGRHSGLLPPTVTTTEQFGIGLEGLGYYKVLNEYFDVTLRGNLYSYGGWSANLTPTYRKRYRYNGGLNLSLQNTKFNFKGDPDFNKAKTFFISWNHSVDPRARPGVIFSANVNAGSTRYNRFVTNNPIRNFQNQLNSSITYQKSWAGRPYNLSLSANHSQNSATRVVQLLLPDAGFTVNTIYPLQKKEIIGTPKWYEKLGIGYNGVARNQISFYDSAFTIKKLLDTLQWGAQHNIPISLSLPPLGPFIVSPSISYQEQWMMRKFIRKWNASEKKVDSTYEKGFYTSRQMSFGVGFNTSIFGTVQFRNSKVVAIRHVMRPNFGLNYTPSLNNKNFYDAQVDTSGQTGHFSVFEGNLFTGYSDRKFGGISFGIDNSLEMKVRSKKDTTAGGFKKVRLIDGFGFTSSYNFLQDSLQLGDFNLYLRSTLFDKINLTASANVSPYQVNRFGQLIDRFTWADGGFKPGRLSNASISLSTQFRSKPRDPAIAPQNTQANTAQLNDPSLLGDQQRLLEYKRRNPSEFVDFNIPWDIGIDFSAQYSRQIRADYSGFDNNFDANFNFRNSFSLTPKWNFSTNGLFSLDSKKLEYFTMSINREMHCWQMSIGVTPVGLQRSFSITISPKSSILQDLRVNRTRVFTNY